MTFIPYSVRNMILVAITFIPCMAYADVLELKSGKVLNGVYMGGTQSSIRFESSGKLQVIPAAEIIALTFTGQAKKENTPAASQNNQVSSATTPSTSNAGTSTGQIPVGTRLLVKLKEDVTTANKKKGARFTAVLENKLVINGKTLVPSGATVYGNVLKSQRGGIGARRAVFEITLAEILIDGELKTIKTSILAGKGEKGGLGKKIIKGAAIGALADGSSGAETGAKVGVGVAILSGGRHAGLKTGSVVEFTLVQALTL